MNRRSTGIVVVFISRGVEWEEKAGTDNFGRARGRLEIGRVAVRKNRGTGRGGAPLYPKHLGERGRRITGSD